MGTHEVTNQPPPRVDVDEYATHTALVEAVHRHGANWADESLHEVGRLVGSAGFQRAAERAHRAEPVLHTHDRYGHRIDTVEYDDAYHQVISAAVRHGAHARAWSDPRTSAHVARAATFMLFAQVEPGHACPMSMTYSAVPTLRTSPDLAAEWEPRLLSEEYDARLVPAADKYGALFGMAMTEKQGGSDVRANTTTATRLDDGTYALTGHKWFCSAPMSDGFLVLAQTRHGADPDVGVSCFLLPRVLPDGSRNTVRIQRLKDKLGNRSNASAEIELDAAHARLVGEPGRGVRTIIEMVGHTRLDCVLGTAAGMRQSAAEALWHARHRRAFGAELVDQPLMTSVLADLCLESEAAVATGIRLARAHDADASDEERAFRRLATAVSKYWVCKRGPHHAYEALECLGGNGYTESFPLARRYREQPVMAIWEGSGNVIALDVLRAVRRDPASVEALDAELAAAAGTSRTYDDHLARVRASVRSVAGDDSDAQARMRRLTEDLALALQASLLIRHAPDAVSAAFVAARLGPDRGHQYGILPDDAKAAEIVARH